MLRRFTTVLVISFLGIFVAKAQYDPSYSHYFSMEPSFNPASVGKENQLNVVGAYALDFAGFEHNPNTFYVGADMPLYFLKNYHGVGASIMNDKIGLFTHQRIAGQYAFRFNLLGGRLAAGVQAGLIMETFDGSKLDVEQSNDPALPSSQVTGNSLDLGFGLYYTHKNWYAGLSAIVRAYNYKKERFAANNIFGSLNIYAGYNFGAKKEYRKKKAKK